MTFLSKLLITIGIIAIFGILGFIVYHHFQLSNQLNAVNTQIVAQKELADGIMRAQASWATKNDLELFATQHKLDLKAIETDLATLKANLSAINQVMVVSGPQQGNNLPSTGTTPITQPGGPGPISAPAKCKDGTPCPNPDLYGYLANRQTFHLDENFGTDKVPFGEVGFSANLQKPWDINIPSRQYNLTTVLGTNDAGRQYAYNKFSINVNNKDYTVKIANNIFQQEYPTAKFNFFNPHLYLGTTAGVNLNVLKGNVTPNLSISLMSYGKFLNQPDFKILDIGVGYDLVSQKFQGILTPVSYNIGQNLPLMNNLYIGPSLQIGTDGNIAATIGLSVGL